MVPSLLDHSRYIEDCVRSLVSPSSIFNSPGFRLEYIAVDSMHCGDLGVFPDCIGGLFWQEICNKEWHRTQEHGIIWLNLELKKYYSANPGRSQLHLTLGMLKGKTGQFPTLKCKAAECRHLAPFAVVLAHKHAFGDATRGPFAFQVDRLRPYSAEYRTLAVSMATCMNGYHEACVAEPFVAAVCRSTMHGFIQALTDKRGLFRRHLPAVHHASQCFPFRPQGHMLEHIVDQKILLWGSPRGFWCYADEDFVGLVKRIAVQTKHPRTMERVLLEKYRLFADLHAYALANAIP